MNKYRIAIVGFGNIGKFAVEAIENTPDMELAGVIRRKIDSTEQAQFPNITFVTSIVQLDNVDAVLITTPTRTMRKYSEEYLKLGINTIDSFDIHKDIYDLKENLEVIAQKNKSVSIIASGWDPGSDSMVRGILEIIAPKGITYTNFGPGMSMGHTVAVKAIKGVKDALSITIPTGTGIHRRLVYVEIGENENFENIKTEILKDPYFINDETYIEQVDNVDTLIDKGHGVHIERKGVSGKTYNQLLEFSMKINNPAVTAQVMVSSARASFKQKPGAYTLIEIPIIDFLAGSKKGLINKLV